MTNQQSDSATNTTIDKWAAWLLYQRFQNRPPQEKKEAVELLKGIRDRILDGAQLQPGQRVLDLGSGTGLLTLGAIAQVLPGGSVWAADISTDSLCACRQDAVPLEQIPIHYVTANGLTLPFQEGTFNAVIMRSVLIYIKNKTRTLNDCYRVLQPGGTLSLFEPVNRDRTHNVDLAQLPNWILKCITQEKQAVYTNDDPMLGFGKKDLIRYATDAGFKKVEIKADVVEEALLDVQAVNRYFDRVPAPGRQSPRQYYTHSLGEAGFHLYQQSWLDALTNGPICFQTPVVFLTASKVE